MRAATVKTPGGCAPGRYLAYIHGCNPLTGAQAAAPSGPEATARAWRPPTDLDAALDCVIKIDDHG